MMQLYHILEEETGWSKSTVVTMLGRMVDKGLAAYHAGGRAREYYPLVSKEDVPDPFPENKFHILFRLQ